MPVLMEMIKQCKKERKVRSLPEVESFESFFRAHPPSVDYSFGRHTTILIDELDKTTKMLEYGKSRYLIVTIPFRHGKSDIVSRRYGAWHLIRNQDHEVILTSYNYSLATDLSYDLRKLVTQIGKRYGVRVEDDKGSVGAWRLANRKGAVYATGLGGTITGRGGNIIIVDDYCKNREQAESELMRDKVWDSFKSDLLTRVAPVHAIIIVANRWHEDDLVGRIQSYNNPDSANYDLHFPKFEHVSFPAWNEETQEWLFPERFNEDWYKAARSVMSEYAWNAQAQQDPIPRIGNLLRVDLVNFVEEKDIPENLQWRRGWDVASTEREVIKDDPDRTVGTLAAFHRKTGALFVKDVVWGQWSAMKREARIIQIADRDGRSVTVKVEAVGGYKDAYERIKQLLRGTNTVRKVVPSTDKISRASYLEPIFEGERVFIVKQRGERLPWFEMWRKELASFPSGKHDDMVDSLVVAVLDDIKGKVQQITA